ncbi:MAG: hypothetical protein U0263_18840 [Polyangiaceae bacterium]
MPKTPLALALWAALLLPACSKDPPRVGEHPSAAALPRAEDSAPGAKTRVRAVGQLGPGRGTLVVSLDPPENGKLTAGAPLVVEARGEHLAAPSKLSEKLDPSRLPLRIPIDVVDGASGPVTLQLSYYWCGVGEGSACHPEKALLEVELDTSGDAPGGEAHLSHRARGS